MRARARAKVIAARIPASVATQVPAVAHDVYADKVEPDAPLDTVEQQPAEQLVASIEATEQNAQELDATVKTQPVDPAVKSASPDPVHLSMAERLLGKYRIMRMTRRANLITAAQPHFGDRQPSSGPVYGACRRI